MESVLSNLQWFVYDFEREWANFGKKISSSIIENSKWVASNSNYYLIQAITVMSNFLEFSSFNIAKNPVSLKKSYTISKLKSCNTFNFYRIFKQC